MFKALYNKLKRRHKKKPVPVPPVVETFKEQVERLNICLFIKTDCAASSRAIEEITELGLFDSVIIYDLANNSSWIAMGKFNITESTIFLPVYASTAKKSYLCGYKRFIDVVNYLDN